jgi:uncharacterized protein (UPF0332 family)
MTLSPDEKRDISAVRIQKAAEFLEDARASFNEKRYRTSVNRSYYAVLNAVRALLIMDGANPETHEGIITMLSLRFIKPEKMPVSVIKDFKVLLSRRTDVDYGDFDSIDREDSNDSLTKAETIINEIEKALKSF